MIDILTWIDENFNKVNKEILYEIMELILSKQNTNVMTQLLGNYAINYHLNNNMAFFIQQNWQEQEEIQQNIPYLKKAISTTKLELEKFEVDTEQDILLKIKYLYSLINNYLQITACYS